MQEHPDNTDLRKRARYARAMGLGPLWLLRGSPGEHTEATDSGSFTEEIASPVAVSGETMPASLPAQDDISRCQCGSMTAGEVNLALWVHQGGDGLRPGLLLVDVSLAASSLRSSDPAPDPALLRRLFDNVVYSLTPQALSWTVRLVHDGKSGFPESQQDLAALCPACAEKILKASVVQQGTVSQALIPVIAIGGLTVPGAVVLPSLLDMFYDNQKKRLFWERYTTLLSTHPALAGMLPLSSVPGTV